MKSRKNCLWSLFLFGAARLCSSLLFPLLGAELLVLVLWGIGVPLLGAQFGVLGAGAALFLLAAAGCFGCNLFHYQAQIGLVWNPPENPVEACKEMIMADARTLGTHVRDPKARRCAKIFFRERTLARAMLQLK